MGWKPNWSYTYVPTPAEWNDAFEKKQDDIGLSTGTTEALAAGVNMPGGIVGFNKTNIIQGLTYTPLDVAANLADVEDTEQSRTNLGIVVTSGGGQIGGTGIGVLDSSGHLLLEEAPASLIGALQYQGTWNAYTNLPTVLSGDGQMGQYYKVSVPGFTLVDGNSVWDVGDYILFNGVSWDRLHSGSAQRTSVAVATGAYTVNWANGPLQYISNTGGFTITAPTSDGQCSLLVTNGSGAGTITWSGFGVAKGDAFTTTSGHKFLVRITRINGFSFYYNQAYQ